MDINQQKEQFSNAYLRAVASVAGYTCYKPEPDTDSVDWGIAAVGGKGTTRSPRVEMQLKCTGRSVMDVECVRFPLKIKNYDDLRAENYQVPRILIVVAVPQDIKEWLLHSEEELAMRHCGYWVSLRGHGASTNSETVTVALPRKQQFTVDALRDMMVRIGNGDLP
jgi:hypothetical protein